jgi:oxygen-independent coproporphyrinogen-3 oxidase
VSSGGGAGLYLHVPFCSAVCPYCDFAVVPADASRSARYVQALLAELALLGEEELSFDTIYFGGGTPSALSRADLESILDASRRSLAVEEDAWLALEANPEDVDAVALEGWRGLGVNMLSLGVQSFQAGELRFLGRRHSPAEGERAVREALAAGFDIVSADLIFGLPGQEPESLRDSIRRLVELDPQHVSCYQLTVHEGTPFHRRRQQGRLLELGESRQGELFELVHSELAAAGYSAYEVSNFAKTEDSRSRHNQKYWDHSSYLGAGLAAHSFSGCRRWWNEPDLERYCSRLERGERPLAGSEELDSSELALEAVMLGLRRSCGLDLERLRADYGIHLLERNAAIIEGYVEDGLAVVDGCLRLTPRGLAVADAVVRSLDLGLA